MQQIFCHIILDYNKDESPIATIIRVPQFSSGPLFSASSFWLFDSFPPACWLLLDLLLAVCEKSILGLREALCSQR